MRNDNSLIQNLIDSFNYAIRGLITAVSEERNMKIHYAVALLVLFASLFFDLSKVEYMALFITVVLVIVSELFNTAIEKFVDLVSPEYNENAKIIKDVSAGAVLLTAINSVIVGFLLFFDKLDAIRTNTVLAITESPIFLTVIAIVLVTVITLGLKAAFSRYSSGTALQGGAVSGHTSVSFCAATIISTISDNLVVTILSYFMAFLVAESRIEGKIHSFYEVLAGGVLGTLIGVLIFQILAKY